MASLNSELIAAACGENREKDVCNAAPINVTKGYRQIKIEEVSAEDWAVFSLFFAVLIFIGILSAFRNRGSLSGFFLTARSANWLLIGMSMFAANIGSSHFIGVTGSAVAYGISAAVYELNALFVIPLLGWVFTPVYMASNVSTMPEYLRARFGGRRIQIYIACNALFMYIFTKISSDLYAGKLFLKASLGIDNYASIILLLVVAALLTIIGGMTAVLWTNAAQLLVLSAGAFYLMAKVLNTPAVNGVENLLRNYMSDSQQNEALSEFSFLKHDNHTKTLDAIKKCGEPPTVDKALHLIQPADDTENAPWPGVLFGVTILSIWYWCNDQVTTQHVLASKNLSHAKLGCLLTMTLKFLPLFIFVLPGMAARVIYPDIVACSDPILCCCFCQMENGCTNQAYILAAVNDPETGDYKLTPGARGFMAITITAALISSFTAVFNACSAIFTMDIWRLVRPKASSKELQIVGRVFIFIVCTVSLLWMVIVNNQHHLLSYMQSMTSYFSPPLAAIFLLAIFWTRCSEQGAFLGLMIGLAIGIIRFSLEFAYLPRSSCAKTSLLNYDIRPPALQNVHYLYFGMILFGITALVTVCLSLVSKPPDQSRISGLTYWTRYEQRIMRLRGPQTKRHSSNSAKHKDKSKVEGEHNATSQFFEQDGKNTSNREIAKWRHLVNWLCGIEMRVSEASDLNISRRAAVIEPSEQLSPSSRQNECSNDSNNDALAPGSFNLVPISSSLFEVPWLNMVCSFALVTLLTISIFLWVLLF